MPANLTPQYFEAEERFKSATTAEEQLTALQEMLRVIPKHKGTEKMQADLKRRLARLRKESLKQKSKGGHRRPFHYVEREGAGRVVLCGPPNSGKSLLLSKLTHAEVAVADFPFTTRAPQPGMMTYEDIQIQLVDTPPLAKEILEAWQLAMIEQADLSVLLFDLVDAGLLDQTEYILSLFQERGILLKPAEGAKVQVLGNKVDLPGGKENYLAWRELFVAEFEPRPFSVLLEGELGGFKRMVFDALGIVRVYTRAPGSTEASKETPFVLKQGATVLEAAYAVHKDLANDLKFARIWGSGKYDGQRVERDYVLRDGDLLEIHT